MHGENMATEEYNNHIREMYRAIFEKDGIEAIIDNLIYWRDKSDELFKEKRIKSLQDQISFMNKRLKNIKKSAKEYKKEIDFVVRENIEELKKLEEMKLKNK